MTKILLVGCGKMGGALLAGWLDRGIAPEAIVAVEPSSAAVAGVTVVPGPRDIPAGFSPDVVVLAVKPQAMAEAAAPYAAYAAQAVFLSIAAGRKLAFFETLLGADAAVVRAMPNTPAAVRRGITVCTSRTATALQRNLCQDLLEAVGEVAWIEDETMMDAVTAVSGSGPAYVFLLAEALARAGERSGLPAILAERLARATVAGAGELLRQSADDAAQLRRNVTSPGGTTAAALAVLMDEGRGLPPIMDEAVAAATARGRELAG